MTITPQELQQVKDRLNPIPIKENYFLVEFVFKNGYSERFIQRAERRIYRNQEYQPSPFALEWDMGILVTHVKVKLPTSCPQYLLQHLLLTDIRYVVITILFKDGSTDVKRKFGLDKITEDSSGTTLDLMTFNPTLGARAEFSRLGTKIK